MITRRELLLTAAAAPLLHKGPYEATWESIKLHYRSPTWFADSKYARHMYSDPEVSAWHRAHYGPQDKFGYKDFIPRFKAEKFNPDEWAALFKRSGARYVMPTAEHHDGFAMYDSVMTQWCAGKMGPKRDLIGDLAKSCRAVGLRFGVSNHRMEHWDFMYPRIEMATDLFDPKSAAFYGPPAKPGTPPTGAWFAEWVARNKEIIDKYQPDLLYFDNGVNARSLDVPKLAVAAHYYNRALEWRKEVSITTKSDAYLAGNILDFEKAARGPKDILADVFQIDDVISDRSWGYTTEMKYRTTASIVNELVDTVSKNDNLLLNLSPRADGTIPDPQQQILNEIGRWLTVNGEAIFGTRPWKQFGDGKMRFTTRAATLYAFVPVEAPPIPTLAQHKVGRVSLLGREDKLEFTQHSAGLHVKLPAGTAGALPVVLKIES
jgi:alpha-L-fucosidase